MAVAFACRAVDAVGGDDEVVRLLEAGRGHRTEAEVHAESAAAVVQYLEEPSAAECGEAVASGGVPYAPVHDVDVVPADEVGLHRLVDHRIRVLDAAEGLVGEDHAEAEGVVGGVALPDGDLTPGIEPLQQSGRVQPTGAAADDRDAGDGEGHDHRPCHFGGRFSVNAAWNSR